MSYQNDDGYKKSFPGNGNEQIPDGGFKYSVKEFLSKISLKLVLDAAITVAIVFLLMIMFAVAVPIKFYAVLTDSMEPTIKVHSLVFINTRFRPETLKQGDIIAFRVDFDDDGEKEVVVHYFHSVETTEDGKKIYHTIAENKVTPDPWSLSEEDLIGKYVDHVSGLGLLVRFLTSPIGKIVLIVDVILVIWIIDLLKHKRKLDREYKERNNQFQQGIKKIQR